MVMVWSLESFAAPIAGTRALVVVAHPDDAEYYCGGTIDRLVESGWKVTALIVTDGERGTDPADPDKQIRRDEQRRAGEVLSVSDVTFLGLRDGDVENTRALRASIVDVIRSERPTLLITHDPLTRRYKQHHDHRQTGFAALEAAFPEAGMASYGSNSLALPWSVSACILLGSEDNDFFVELNTTNLAHKVEALSNHLSQRDSFGENVSSRLEERARELGSEIDPVRPLAEAFKLVEMDRS